MQRKKSLFRVLGPIFECCKNAKRSSHAVPEKQGMNIAFQTLAINCNFNSNFLKFLVYIAAWLPIEPFAFLNAVKMQNRLSFSCVELNITRLVSDSKLMRIKLE